MGRQRAFDPETALDAALGVFWRKGFEGASYADLTAATGVERPALYAAFGNKEALFRKALARYGATHLTYVPAAMGAPTAREVAAALLHGAVELTTRDATCRGCLGVHGALAGSDDAAAAAAMLADARADGEALLRARLERAQQEGDLPATADPATLAAFVMAVMHGIAVQAKAGFSRQTLAAVADQALAGWPTDRRAAPELAASPRSTAGARSRGGGTP